MAQPLIVSIPHKLGKDEAVRRMKAGLGNIRSEYGQLLQVHEEIWSGERLAFSLTALKQKVNGTIDVADDHVRLEVVLPWLLAGMAHGAQAMIRARATRMLEKK
ncbi:MAG: polyhydroxyalkanoic acid system family protein [Afipia sp.]|nr:polyhydroxyalkanoic acid system family protein [Afipia sp.]